MKKMRKPFKLHLKDGDVTDVTFVDDFLVEVAVAEARPPSDEYETDSEDDFLIGRTKTLRLDYSF